MSFQLKQFNSPRQAGFSLVEILVVLTLSAMILASTMMIYGRVRTSAAAVNARLDRYGLPEEILQKIAEDIDRLASPGFDAVITIRNKLENGYNSAQLVIENRYYGNGTPPAPGIYERVVWQTSYIPEEDRLTLYRFHGGLNLEDKLVSGVQTDEDRQKLEVFVPVCPGLTHFYIGALDGGEEPLPNWTNQKMPNGMILGISFAPLVQLQDGSYYLPEETIVWRTTAVDRTRQIAYKFVAKTFDNADPNSVSEKADPNTSGTKTQTTGLSTTPSSRTGR
jgi:prepilin-type N-terminal cleavage/methylation domain-containing protein